MSFPFGMHHDLTKALIAGYVVPVRMGIDDFQRQIRQAFGDANEGVTE